MFFLFQCTFIELICIVSYLHPHGKSHRPDLSFLILLCFLELPCDSDNNYLQQALDQDHPYGCTDGNSNSWIIKINHYEQNNVLAYVYFKNELFQKKLSIEAFFYQLQKNT